MAVAKSDQAASRDSEKLLKCGSLMNLKLFACVLVVGALWPSTQIAAAPAFTPFLSVDVDGYNAGGGQSLGPTAAGYQGWEAAEGLFLDPSFDWGSSGSAGLTKVFSTSEGNITANMIGFGTVRGARNRVIVAGGAGGELTGDFVFAQRNTSEGLGRHYVRLALSGLAPGQPYEVTTFARDPLSINADGFQAWTDRAALGGLDGPAAWLNANVGAGASYLPAAGGANNPIPTFVRAPISGPDSADPYAYSATFLSIADAGGVLTVYGWADPNNLNASTQGASLLSGFQVAVVVPEPSGLVLLGLGWIAVAGHGRRANPQSAPRRPGPRPVTQLSE